MALDGVRSSPSQPLTFFSRALCSASCVSRAVSACDRPLTCSAKDAACRQ